MEDIVPIEKDEERELPVPTCWRDVISQIVEHIRMGEACGNPEIPLVDPIASEVYRDVQEGIASYGEDLVSLPEAAWETSICRWMGGSWQVLVDLFTESGLSDLVLFLKVYERDGGYRFVVEAVHIP